MKHNPRRVIIPILLIIILAALAGWYWWQQQQTSDVNGPLQASGTIEAVEVTVAPEVNGRVVEVMVEKGDLVHAGDALFRLDDTLLQSQRQKAITSLEVAKANVEVAQTGLTTAEAGLDSAKAAVETARAGLDSANNQYQIVLDSSWLADQPRRNEAWKKDIPNEFDQPVWYFEKSEEMAAAEAEMTTAKEALDIEKASYEALVKNSNIEGLDEAATRLANAEVAFLVAKDVLDRAKAIYGEELQDYAQSIYDAAASELEAAQTAYDNLLSAAEATDVMEARARVAVAQARYDIARDRVNAMLTGDESLQVRAALLAVKQAEALVSQSETGVKQAEANQAQAQARLVQAQKAVEQAQADLDVLDVQLSKMVVYASQIGVITTRNIEPGEVVQSGATALVISQLDRLTITVYLPEDRYGRVKTGDRVEVSVDSFPGKKYEATIQRIADQAEFTPRNVQTVEGRRTTVFAVELAVENPDGDLKPGMPADVVFTK